MDCKIFRALLAAFLLLSMTLVACDKDTEEETSTQSMSGSVEFSIPTYVLKGETVTLTASGIINPKQVTYKWYIDGLYSDTLTAPVVTVRFPDSIGVFTVLGVCDADGYYLTSTSKTVSTIDASQEGSLTGLYHGGQSIVDERDGMEYEYVTLGGLDWFAQNLGYLGGNAIAYEGSPSALGLFGAFYTWEEAVSGNICPAGWRVPDNADWESLGAALKGEAVPFVDNWDGLGVKASANAFLLEEKMWPYSPDNLHTNDSGWNAIPLGVTTREGKEWSGVGEYGYWWSTSARNASLGYYRYIYYDRSAFPMASGSKTEMRASVRCVRTHPQS